jgi:hypothetical protein
MAPSQKRGIRKLLAYLGPGFLVAIAYIDPGNCEYHHPFMVSCVYALHVCLLFDPLEGQEWKGLSSASFHTEINFNLFSQCFQQDTPFLLEAPAPSTLSFHDNLSHLPPMF